MTPARMFAIRLEAMVEGADEVPRVLEAFGRVMTGLALEGIVLQTTVTTFDTNETGDTAT